MTTFETLSKTKGSLIIEEKYPMNNVDYTKVIKIRFDNKNEYIINIVLRDTKKYENKTKMKEF